MKQNKSFYIMLVVIVLVLKFTAALSFSSPYSIFDSLPKKSSQKVYIVPFEYKQSALYQLNTFKVIDSVVNILLAHDSITLSIEGYAHVDEGTDSICYYLSLNRALVVKDYILGRGIDSIRIASVKGFGNLRSAHLKIAKKIIEYNCRAEMVLNYPLPPPPFVLADADGDGIADAEDGCPAQYGSKENNGCPDKNAIIVTFEEQQSYLTSVAFNKMDSIIGILLTNPTITMVIEGHSNKTEGSRKASTHLAIERAEIAKNYFLSRNIPLTRIDAVKSYGVDQPITAGRNFWELSQNSRVQIFLIRH